MDFLRIGKISSIPHVIVNVLIINCFAHLLLTDNCDENTQFRCLDNKCIPKSQRCDNKRDCVDGDDEEFCGDSGKYTLFIIFMFYSTYIHKILLAAHSIYWLNYDVYIISLSASFIHSINIDRFWIQMMDDRDFCRHFSKVLDLLAFLGYIQYNL